MFRFRPKHLNNFKYKLVFFEFMEKSVKITLIISAVVLLIVFGSLSFVKDILAPSDTISAVGEARLNVEPDLTTVYFFVETRAEKAEEAKNQNNEIFEKIKTSLIVNGIDKDMIRTEQFNVNEDVEWRDGERIFKGFIAYHYAKVGLDNIYQASKVIDAVIDNNGRINYINFELSQEKQSEYKSEALKLASKDATRKAEAIASGLDRRLGRLVSVETDEFSYNPWPIYAARGVFEEAAVVKQAVTDIEPSKKEVSARVAVKYKIK